MFNSALTSDQVLALFAAGIGVSGFAPQITGQPQSQIVLSNSLVNLKVTGISGTSPLTYQWQLNNTNVNLLVDSTNFTGINSNILSVLKMGAKDAGSYQLLVSNSIGSTVSSNATLSLQSPALVGQWFTNSTLAEVSGYRPPGTHDGYDINGSGLYTFTNDVPPGKTGQSLFLFQADGTGIGISNSSTNDPSYTNTFDNVINGAMTVACWAKGWPGTWNPFMSKFGETTPGAAGGWQLRQDGANNVSPCWTIRGTGGVTITNLGTSIGGNPEDLGATSLTFGNDGNWHFYAGTYDTATGVRSLYVDGVLSAQETNNALYTLSADSHLCIGARDAHGTVDTSGTNTTFLTGEIYDARVYNFSLTSAQVLSAYGIVPVALTQQAPSGVAYTNRPLQLKASASGTQPIQFQWQFNGVNIQALSDSTNFTGATSNILTIANLTASDAGSYQLFATNFIGTGNATVVSSNAIVSIASQNLVGSWLNGASSLADVSGYQAPGTHDGYAVGGTSYSFSSDVPPGKTGVSLNLTAGNTGIAISNSSTSDANYTNTFDDTIHSAVTVSFWAKGFPGAWNPYVSKFGETTPAPCGRLADACQCQRLAASDLDHPWHRWH